MKHVDTKSDYPMHLLVCPQVAADDSTPAVFASLDALLAALVRLASPDALVAALRWALSLRSASLQVRSPPI